MIEILLLVIACCLLFGAEKTKEGIGCLFKVIAMIIIGLILVNFISGFFSDAPEDSSTDTDIQPAIEQQDSDYEYTETTADAMTDDLDDVDAAKAKYLGQRLSITGIYSDINPTVIQHNSYFYLRDINDYYETKWITCNMKSDDQKERVKDLSGEETITVKGLLVSVDEFGYELDIDSID